MTKESNKGFRIFYKILFGILLVPIITMMGTLYIINLGQIERTESLENSLQLQVDGISNDIVRWSQMNRNLLEQNKKNKDILSLNENLQKPILENIEKTYSWVYLAWAIGSDGFKTARSDNKEIFNEDGTKKHFRGDRDYYKQVVNGKDFGEDVVLSRTIDSPAYVLCSPFSKTNNENALCIASKLSNVSKNIVDAKIGETGFAFLVDKKNKVIAYGGQNPAYQNKLEDMNQHPGLNSSTLNSVAEYDYEGKKIISYARVVGNDWTLVVQQDYDEAYSKLNSAKRNAFIIFIITLLFTLFISILISRSLSKPILELTEITIAYSKGKIKSDEILPGADRSDEIGSLSRGIGRMGRSIEIMLNKLA